MESSCILDGQPLAAMVSDCAPRRGLSTVTRISPEAPLLRTQKA